MAGEHAISADSHAAGAATSKGKHMNCYVCTTTGTPTESVALCPHCFAGLCLNHLREEALSRPAGGTNLECKHDTWSPHAAQ